MKLRDDWVFGGFWRGLCEGYYEIYCENFVVDWNQRRMRVLPRSESRRGVDCLNR